MMFFIGRAHGNSKRIMWLVQAPAYFSPRPRTQILLVLEVGDPGESEAGFLIPDSVMAVEESQSMFHVKHKPD